MKNNPRAFERAREAYISYREIERKEIIEHLRKNGFKAETRGGSGDKRYTSGGNLKKSYDLSNWKWIEAERDGLIYFVSLQAFDRDPNSGNYHTLTDRIGICAYPKNNRRRYEKEIHKNLKLTNIDLPMTEEKLNELLAELIRLPTKV